jgi:hypothetical protein
MCAKLCISLLWLTMPVVVEGSPPALESSAYPPSLLYCIIPPHMYRLYCVIPPNTAQYAPPVPPVLRLCRLCRSTSPSPFTGYAFHVGEAALVFANEVLVCFLLPLHVGLHRTYHLATTAIHEGECMTPHGGGRQAHLLGLQ